MEGCIVTGTGYEGTPVVEYRTMQGEKATMPIKVGDIVNWSVSRERHCIGYRAPGASSLEPCPDDAVTDGASQCDKCFERAQLRPCLRCSGERCMNPARRRDCIQPDNHALYLAAFSQDVIKVGVSRWPRRHLRVLEQGARAGRIIARADGLEIRHIETLVGRTADVPDRLSAKTVIRALADPCSLEEMDATLLRIAAGMRQRMPQITWLEEPESVPDLLAGTLPTAHVRLAPQPITGFVRRVAGTTVVLEREGFETVAYDLDSLTGHRILAGAPASTDEQMILFAGATG